MSVGGGAPRDERVQTDDSAVFEAPALLRILWADPEHMAEHLAIWSLTHVGPRASRVVERLQRDHPDAEPGELERMVIEHQTRVAMTEGAFVGGPFLVLIPVAFCASMLAQAQMALELAGLAGYAPDDEGRAADILVLTGAYASNAEAIEGLARVARDPEGHEGKRLARGSRIAMLRRMAYLLGLVGPSEEKPSRLRSAFGVGLFVLVLLVGFVLPLVWVPYMAWAMRRGAVRMGVRGSAFYEARRSDEAGVTVRKGSTVRIAISAGFGRMLLLVLLPVAVALIALLSDLHLGSGRWVSAGISLLVVSALTTLAWLGYHWWRRRRARRSHAAANLASADA